MRASFAARQLHAIVRTRTLETHPLRAAGDPQALVGSFRDWAFPEAWPKPPAPRRPSAQTLQP